MSFSSALVGVFPPGFTRTRNRLLALTLPRPVVVLHLGDERWRMERGDTLSRSHSSGPPWSLLSAGRLRSAMVAGLRSGSVAAGVDCDDE